MEDHELEKLKTVSPWQPETNPLRLAVLGKLAEELSEAAAIVSRCMIQGIDEFEPVTGVLNLDALRNEIADVFATSEIAIDYFDLNRQKIHERGDRKLDHLRRWHSLIEKAHHGQRT